MSFPEIVNPWSSRQPASTPSPPAKHPDHQSNDDLSAHDRQFSEQRTLEFDSIGASDSAPPTDPPRETSPTSPTSRTSPTASVAEMRPKKSSRCNKLHTCCLSLCQPCLTEYNPLPEHPSKCAKLKYALTCPPRGQLSNVVTVLLFVVLTWAVLWSVTGKEALPGGNLFALYTLVIACKIGGALIEQIKLPALLGMLLVGFVLRNVPVVNVAADIDRSWSSSLRAMALVVILLQAGVGLDAGALKRLSIVCVRLCCMPCIAEACTAAVASHFLLGFPWPWGFMLGFVLGAVTPAVIVPSLLSLQARGYGVRQGIPTMVIAAASCDDVLAISAFGVILGTAFSTGNLIYNIFRGPLELLMGVTFGCVAGLLLWYIPDKDQKMLSNKRFILLVYGGVFAVFGSGAARFPGAGALGCLTMAFVAGHKWREQKESVEKLLSFLWMIFEPLLFGLIGAEVSISYLEAATVGLGLATLIIGLCVRMLASMLAVTGAGLTWKEIFFVALAWLPKATVQAAIGSVALDTAKRRGADPEFEKYGIQLLTVAVLSILITAPLGAVAISLTGPRLLRRSSAAQPPDGHNVPRDNGNPGDIEPRPREDGMLPRYEMVMQEDGGHLQENNMLLTNRLRDDAV